MTEPLDRESGLVLAIDLLRPERRQQALHALVERNLITSESLPVWVRELGHDRYGPGRVSDLIFEIGMELGAYLQTQGGFYSSDKALGVLRRLAGILRAAGKESLLQRVNLRDRTVIDFGAGIYTTLSLSIVMFANGFERVIAMEPFEIRTDVAESTAMMTVQRMLLDPAPFIFSGISKDELKQRLFLLDFENMQDRLADFNSGAVRQLDFNGIVLTRTLSTLPANSIDVIFSNSTLEHVTDLQTEVARHRDLLVRGGVCVHTVDFSDHRSIGADVHRFQMYFDGVLANINGLRPSEVEAIFATGGFDGVRLDALNVPAGYLGSTDKMVPAFARFSHEELSIWLRSYVLTKRPQSSI